MSVSRDGPRPPISSYDEPIDDSGAEEAEEKRRQRKNAASLPDAAKEALRLRGLGFTVMPLPTNSKAPPPADWASASKNNPAVFLRNPGTHNYAVLPPPGCFGWDVDKDAPEALGKVEASLGVDLPPTLVTVTPNGRHVFYRWPEDLPRPRGPMFGSVVTRWPFGDEGQGYLVGPGSVVVQENGSLGTYHLSLPDERQSPTFRASGRTQRCRGVRPRLSLLPGRTSGRGDGEVHAARGRPCRDALRGYSRLHGASVQPGVLRERCGRWSRPSWPHASPRR